jgi:predicted ABC-type ATPase
VIAVFRPTRPGDADAVLRCVRTLRAAQAVIERRGFCPTGEGGGIDNSCGTNEGGGGGGDSGGSGSGSSAGNDMVDSAGGGADGPAHSKGSKAHAEREAHRSARRADDYPEVRPSKEHSAIRHTVEEPQYDSRGQYIPPSRPSDWTPERQSMHSQIIADATASVPRSQEPTLYMMGGGPAAGKSSMIESGVVKHPSKHVLSNPDDLKNDIPEYRDGLASGDHRSAAFSHEESSYLNKQVMRAAAKNGQDVVWDGTGDNSVDKLEKQIRVLKDRGYKVQADYVTCDTEVAVERSNARAAKTGRAVPPDAIRETHSRVSEIWPEAVSRGLFDRSDLYDTNSGGKPVLIARARGTSLEVLDKAAYQKFLDKAKR